MSTPDNSQALEKRRTLTVEEQQRTANGIPDALHEKPVLYIVTFAFECNARDPYALVEFFKTNTSRGLEPSKKYIIDLSIETEFNLLGCLHHVALGLATRDLEGVQIIYYPPLDHNGLCRGKERIFHLMPSTYEAGLSSVEQFLIAEGFFRPEPRVMPPPAPP